ncbi:MAG: hypothetical protein AAFQ43_12230 [Bacteroidota bacterium]
MLALLALLLAAPTTDCAPAPNYGRVTECEVRTLTLGARESLVVRSPVSGGIQVVAWDRDEIGVRAEVRAFETDERTTAELLAAAEIRTTDTLTTDLDGGGWVESRFILSVPRHIDLDLWTNNGSVTVEGVSGDLHIDTNNGAVRLAGLGGDVTARSNNGSVTVDLDGATWDGAGLDAFANNGTLTLRVPDGYDAIVEAAVRWGYINEPDALSPASETRKVWFGRGGPTLSVGANSGSVQIERG